MSKRLFKTLVAVLAIAAAATGPARAQSNSEQLFYTLDGTQTGGSANYFQSSEITQGGISWWVTGNTTENPWRIGGKSLNAVDRDVYGEGSLDETVTKVSFDFGTNSGVTVNSITMFVASDANFADIIEQKTVSYSANSTVDVTPGAGFEWTDAYYMFTFNVTVSGSSNKYFQLKSIKFYYTSGGSTPEPEPAPAVPHTVRFAAGNDGWSVTDVDSARSATAPAILQNVMAGDSLVVTAPASLNRKVKSVKAVKYVPPVPVQSIVLNKQTAYLAKDSTMTLTATVLPENAADKSYSWSSDDIAVADVDQNGVVIGHNAGTANIIATANDGSGAKDTCVVTVLSPAILDGVTVLYVSNNDNWSTVMGYNPGLMYQDGGKVRLTSNGAFLYHDGHTLFVDDLFYPGINGYQWLRVVEIGGIEFYYHQGETWQDAIEANRQGNQHLSIESGQVKLMGYMTLIDTDSEPVDPSATIDPTVDYGYIM